MVNMYTVVHPSIWTIQYIILCYIDVSYNYGATRYSYGPDKNLFPWQNMTVFSDERFVLYILVHDRFSHRRTLIVFQRFTDQRFITDYIRILSGRPRLFFLLSRLLCLSADSRSCSSNPNEVSFVAISTASTHAPKWLV